MEINVREYVVRVCIITLNGRVDAFSVKALRDEQEAQLAGGKTQFILDLSQVEFMDSSGMAALVSLLKRARQAGGNVVLVNPVAPAARRILTLTRFDQVFIIVDTVDKALEKF
jgi:anti-sigma B factor antagonist